ncbi:MAG TPA: sulfotransferase [Pyrinomonadaceae bacterium]|nr:sulfotransferase [Pyrinomonadaceae bacterium]
MTLPNFLIIGAQKSASTFIHVCLAEHPEVFMPLSEIPYFEDPEFQQIKREEFEQLFSRVSGEKAVGIKRPNYLAKPEVPARIKEMVPEAKLIAVLRNPVQRAVSAYFHYVNNGFIQPAPLEKSLTRLLDGEYRKSFPKAEEILEYGLYHKHLERYLSFFDRERILVLFQDEIAKDNLAQLQRAYRFLEIDDSYVPRQLNDRPQAVVYSIPRLKILRLRNERLYDYNSERTRLYIREQSRLDRAVCRTIDRLDRHFLSRVFGNEKPALGEELRRRLHEFYAGDVGRLEELLGVNLERWKYREKR